MTILGNMLLVANFAFKMLQEGKACPTIHKEYPLEEAAQAQADIESTIHDAHTHILTYV